MEAFNSSCFMDGQILFSLYDSGFCAIHLLCNFHLAQLIHGDSLYPLKLYSILDYVLVIAEEFENIKEIDLERYDFRL